MVLIYGNGKTEKYFSMKPTNGLKKDLFSYRLNKEMNRAFTIKYNDISKK